MIKKGLGKGLEALIPGAESEEGSIVEVDINSIEPNINQPRKIFDSEKIKQLSESIRQHGVIQPLIVKKEKDFYKIVAGERRWRAAREAGVRKIPVVIREVSDREAMEIALIENLQREDLNPLEEAEAYQRLVSEFGMSHEEIALKVGKSRPAVANSLRLLNLAPRVKKMVQQGKISGGHARALLAINDYGRQGEAAETIVNKDMSVRETERYVNNLLERKPKTGRNKKLDSLEDVEERLQSIFGTKVRISRSSKKGKIMIEFYSTEELTRLIDLMETIEKSKHTNVSRETKR